MPSDPHPPVRLVGAGPGPADLLTVRAHVALREAEAVLYDALIDPDVLELAPRACLRIRTGKRARAASMSQEVINRLTLRLARRGLRVVRLKGGDPSLFGRSGEEVAFLKAHGVAVEIIPGVTAASAAAAQYQFPLTQRGLSRGLTFMTGSTAEGGAAGGLEAGEGTLALYMARDGFSPIAEGLIAAGRGPRTPAAAIENAGRPEARLIAGDLGTLPDLLAAADLKGPVVILVGAVLEATTAACRAAPPSLRYA